ncbi:hypothetical protein EBZ39_16730 [bacterium]|nr:hypothetical protein [bacterium]
MPNVLYPKAKYKLLAPGTLGASSSTSISFASDDIYAALVDLSKYTYNSGHEFANSISSAVGAAVPVLLTGKIVIEGRFQADATTLTVTEPVANAAIVLYKKTPSGDAASPLIAYLDTFSAPLTNVLIGPLTIQWAFFGVFSLSDTP